MYDYDGPEFMIDGVEYSLWTNLVDGGINEDGEMIINECYSVAATYENGERFLRFARFVCPGYGNQVIARARAIRLLRRIQVGSPDPKKSEFWQATYPVYGSPAYSESDTVAWERRVDEDDSYSRMGH